VSKGQETKQRIIEQAAEYLNQHGYFSTAVSEIMELTGLQKGGIYNHFESKEDLALQAFDYAIEQMSQKFAEALKGKENAIDRMLAIISYFRGYGADTPMPGGCPIMNCAIEGDDAHPALRDRARKAMDQLRGTFIRIIAKGISRGEIRADINPDATTTVLVSTLEGAVMLTNLYKNPVHLHRVMDHLTAHIESLRA
jgi:TetR/AcrR family transcriptional repressor of nem operon